MIVRKVSVEMLEQRRSEMLAEATPRPSTAFVSALDAGLMSSVIRFLRALMTGPDRRILTPAYLPGDGLPRFAGRAVRAASGDRREPAEHLHENLAEPVTVADLAEQVAMSPSAFTALVRQSTGKSPYQFLKEMRLTRARDLLVRGNGTVASVSRAVGYPHASHFINEFRRRFRLSPPCLL
ncbi:helix-turn-helix domain-containing protein [Amycolatopsis thermoflava]